MSVFNLIDHAAKYPHSELGDRITRATAVVRTLILNQRSWVSTTRG